MDKTRELSTARIMVSPGKVAFSVTCVGIIVYGIVDYLSNFEQNNCMMTYMFEMPEYIVRVNLLNMKHNCHKPWQEHSHCLTSCFGLMTDSTVIDSALVDAALRKSGLISNGCSGFIIYVCGLLQIRPYIKWKRIIKK
jgi:hypothetical protein